MFSSVGRLWQDVLRKAWFVQQRRRQAGTNHGTQRYATNSRRSGRTCVAPHRDLRATILAALIERVWSSRAGRSTNSRHVPISSMGRSPPKDSLSFIGIYFRFAFQSSTSARYRYRRVISVVRNPKHRIPTLDWRLQRASICLKQRSRQCTPGAHSMARAEIDETNSYIRGSFPTRPGLGVC